MKLGNFLELERKIGEPIYRQNGRTIRPISRILTFSWRPYGGGVWNWPTAIEVEENGAVQELPIVHVNLLAEIAIGVMVFTAAVLMWNSAKRR